MDIYKIALVTNLNSLCLIISILYYYTINNNTNKNNIGSLPLSMGNMTSLRRIYISFNPITGNLLLFKLMIVVFYIALLTTI